MKYAQESVVIWGASGHAKVVADAVRLEGRFHLVGFLDDVDPQTRQFLGLPVFGGAEALGRLREDGVTHIVFGFGNCDARLRLSEVAKKEGFSLATVIHPNAVVASDVTIGEGTVVFAGAVVNSGSTIGANVIINTKASVDHDCVIADGAHVCPGTTIGGGVSVGSAAWLGIGSTIKDHVTIGASALVGAGSVVISDIPDAVVAYGVPAATRRQREL
jgi:sugar O-acyltransferase, sialic acid O-acetyltransferase NeuD family